MMWNPVKIMQIMQNFKTYCDAYHLNLDPQIIFSIPGIIKNIPGIPPLPQLPIPGFTAAQQSPGQSNINPLNLANQALNTGANLFGSFLGQQNQSQQPGFFGGERTK